MARDHFLQSLEIAEELGIQEIKAIALYGLSRISVVLKDMEAAKKYGEDSLIIFSKLSHEKINEVQNWLADWTSGGI